MQEAAKSAKSSNIRTIAARYCTPVSCAIHAHGVRVGTLIFSKINDVEYILEFMKVETMKLILV